MSSNVLTTDEAERQLVAAAERHREMLGSMQELGRPDAGQHVAVKALDRAVRLVCFALRRGAQAGIPSERLVVLTGWDPALVAEGLQQLDDPHFVALLVPAGLDHIHVAQTAAGVSATARLHDLTQEILAGVLNDETWAPSPDELDRLHDRLAAEWTDWRDAESDRARRSS
jgi:hypothetical protein